MSQHVSHQSSNASGGPSFSGSSGSWHVIPGPQGYISQESQGVYMEGGGGREGGAPPPLPPREQSYPHHYQHLGPEVKLPPSYHPQPAPRSGSSFAPSGSEGAPSVRNVPAGMAHMSPGHSAEQVPVIPMSDIVKQLDFAANENLRLRRRLEDNNQILDQKLREIEECMRDKEKEKLLLKEGLAKDKEDLVRRESEATNKFFEARVAVMGYKCRNMQLQGELESKKGDQDLMAELAKVTKEKYLLEEEVRRGGGGGGGGGTGSLQIQVEKIQREKRAVEAERENLVGVVNGLRRELAGHGNQLQQELQRVLEAKEAQERVIEQLQQDNMAARDQAGQQLSMLHNEVERLHEELSRNQQQSLQSYHSKTQEVSAFQAEAVQLRGQVYHMQQELSQSEQYRATVEEKLRVITDQKETLEAKVAELKQARDILGQKVQEVKSSSSPPVPKPRTNLMDSEKQRLIVEKEQLERELAEVRRQLSLDENARQTAENLLQDARTKAQELSLKNSELKQRVEARAATESEESKREKRSLEERCSQLQRELAQAQTSVEMASKGRSSEYEQECRRLMSEKSKQMQTISDLQARCAELEKSKARVTPPVEKTSVASKKPLAVRLNDAVGEIKRLEQALAAAESVKEQFKLENESLEQNNMSKLQSNEELRREQESLVREKHEAIQQIDSYRRDLGDQKDRYEARIAQLEADQSEGVAELSLKDDRIRELNRTVEKLREEQRNVLTVELQKKGQTCDQLQQNLQQKDQELHGLRQNASRLQAQLQGLEGEGHKAKEVLTKYKDECQSLMGDYSTCAEQLRGVTEERDRLKQQVDVSLRELTKRADKIKQLEKQREESVGRIEHMDIQLKTYIDDFERERRSREELAESVKILQGGNTDQAAEIKNLKGQLMHYVAEQFRHEGELEDEGRADPGYGGHRTSSREHRFPPSNFPPSPNQPVARRQGSGEQHLSPLRRSREIPLWEGQPTHGRRPDDQTQIPRMPVTGIPTTRELPKVYPVTQMDPPRPDGYRTSEIRPTTGNLTGSGRGLGFRTGAEINQPELFHRPQASMPGPPLAGPRGGMPPSISGQPMVAGIGGLPNNFGPSARLPGMTGLPSDVRPLGSRPAGAPPPVGIRPAVAPPPVALPMNRSMWDPGERRTEEPPKMACPICQRNDLRTQAELELHCAQCTGP